MTRILITSALPYINGIKHLGNLAGSMLPADVYARFQRARGRETLYICATDEHGTPAELAAAEAGQVLFAAEPSDHPASGRGAGGQRPDRRTDRQDGLLAVRQAFSTRPLHRGDLS